MFLIIYSELSKIKIMKANKDTAFFLIGKYYSYVTKREKEKGIDLTNSEFYIYEKIAKGYALLEVERDSKITKNQKKRLFNLIDNI